MRMPSLSSNPPPQLMYEVLADQTMWAVCGRTAGIVSLETVEKQSVTLDVMPLTSGYLPLPVVRLSRYIPATESKNGKFKYFAYYVIYYLICEQICQIFIEDICYNLKEKDIMFASKLYEFL